MIITEQVTELIKSSGKTNHFCHVPYDLSMISEHELNMGILGANFDRSIDSNFDHLFAGNITKPHISLFQYSTSYRLTCHINQDTN